MFAKIFRSLLILGFVTTAAPLAQAQADDSQDEAAVRKTARLRQYPGGVDEEPLKVQDPLPLIKKDGDNEMTLPAPVDAD
jgi:hypothetical protein